MPAGSIAVTFAASCGCDLIFVAIGEVVVPPVVVPPVVVPPVVVPPVVVPPVVVPPVVVPPVVVPPVVVPPVIVPAVFVVRGDLPWVLVVCSASWCSTSCSTSWRSVSRCIVVCDAPSCSTSCDVLRDVDAVADVVVVDLCDEPCVDGPWDVSLVVVGGFLVGGFVVVTGFVVVVDFVAGPWLVVCVLVLCVFGAPDVVTRVGAGAWPCP